MAFSGTVGSLCCHSPRPCCSKSDDFHTFGPIFLEKGFEREVRMEQPPQENRPKPGGWGINCWVQQTPQGG